jgi:TIR domain
LSTLYDLAVLGSPTEEIIESLAREIEASIAPFGLKLYADIGWNVRPAAFDPEEAKSAAVIYFGGADAPRANLEMLLGRGIPILPVVSNLSRVHAEIPDVLRPLNCLAYDTAGPSRAATALLECVGLLPRQRRVFLSYRRDEARDAALQLFDALSARLFDVFLDTHGVAPGEDFQSLLWHRLCDADVLLMLDTPNYFASRWTSAEYGRALAKGISVLRVGWPQSRVSPRTATASQVSLESGEINIDSGRLIDAALARICNHLEGVRSQSLAVRNLNLVSNIRGAVESIGGRVEGVGCHRAIYVRLADGKPAVIYPTVGVPTSVTLHDAAIRSPGGSVAVVYDHVGLHPSWQGHLDWLGKEIRSPRWIRACEVAWQFADWGE